MHDQERITNQTQNNLQIYRYGNTQINFPYVPATYLQTQIVL